MMVCDCESGSQGITERQEPGCWGLRERELHCQEERGVCNRQPPAHAHKWPREHARTSIRLSGCSYSHKLMMGNIIFTEKCNLLGLVFSYSHINNHLLPLRAILFLSIHVYSLQIIMTRSLVLWFNAAAAGSFHPDICGFFHAQTSNALIHSLSSDFNGQTQITHTHSFHLQATKAGN